MNLFLLIEMKYFHFAIFRYPRVIPFSKNMLSELGNFFRVLAISDTHERPSDYTLKYVAIVLQKTKRTLHAQVRQYQSFTYRLT